MNLGYIMYNLTRKSWRLTMANITERVVFDVAHGIDTITQVAKDDYIDKPDNLDHGIHYASSWTSEIRYGFKAVLEYLKDDFENFAFMDIGCGKGKVQIVWELLLRKHKLKQRVYGVDYYDALIDQAMANHRKALGFEGTFIHADATTIDYYAINPKLIIYLYNPFDAKILAHVAQALKPCEVMIIYNNPLQAQALLDNGFSVLDEKWGFHPQADTVIYTNMTLNSNRKQGSDASDADRISHNIY